MRSRASAEGSPIRIGASVAASTNRKQRESAARRLDRGRPNPYQHEGLVGENGVREQLQHQELGDAGDAIASISPKRT